MRTFPLERYGQWAGREQGYPYDPMRCAYEVFPDKGIQYQCIRKPGHGRDGLFCKQHAVIVARFDQ